MDIPKLFDLGYQKLKPEQLLRWVEDHNAVVFDVRLSPRSRNPRWNRSVLEGQFGQHYLYVGELGNLNYKGGPIKIQDLEKGLGIVIETMEKFSAGIIMCVCGDRKECHRLEVVKAMEYDHGLVSTPLTANEIIEYAAQPAVDLEAPEQMQFDMFSEPGKRARERGDLDEQEGQSKE